MEELCFYIAGNAYLLDKSFMSEELCTWVEKQMGLYKLADRLRDIMRSKGLLSDFAETILRQTVYLEEAEIAQALKTLREMEEGTYRPRDRRLANKSFGKDVVRNIKTVNS